MESQGEKSFRIEFVDSLHALYNLDCLCMIKCVLNVSYIVYV